MKFAPTRAELARMFPRALPEWLDALEDLAPKLCAHYGVERLEWCHMAGQIAAETDGLSLRRMAENMRFTSTKRIMEVYSYRLGLAIQAGPVFGKSYASKVALAGALVNQPEMLADVVYGGPHGREGTPPWQGSRYIGRGPLQTTHLNNYRAARDEIRKQPGGKACPDLVEHPEVLADDPGMGVRALFAEWSIKGLRRWALADDCDTLSDVLNTGNARDNVKPHGLPRRRRETARAKAIWPAGQDRPAEPHSAPVAGVLVLREGMRGQDVLAAQKLLVARGYAVGAVDGKFGPLTRRAVLAFQGEHALPVDGALDAADMAVLEQTAPLDLGARAEATTVPGSDQVAAGAAIKRTGGAALLAGAAEISGDVMGVSPVGIASAYLEHIGGLLGKVSGLGMAVPPKVVTLALVCIAGLTLWKWGAAIIERRVEKYRAGLDLSR